MFALVCSCREPSSRSIDFPTSLGTLDVHLQPFQNPCFPVLASDTAPYPSRCKGVLATRVVGLVLPRTVIFTIFNRKVLGQQRAESDSSMSACLANRYYQQMRSAIALLFPSHVLLRKDIQFAIWNVVGDVGNDIWMPTSVDSQSLVVLRITHVKRSHEHTLILTVLWELIQVSIS